MPKSITKPLEPPQEEIPNDAIKLKYVGKDQFGRNLFYAEGFTTTAERWVELSEKAKHEYNNSIIVNWTKKESNQ
jgi:hypothetical protein